MQFHRDDFIRDRGERCPFCDGEVTSMQLSRAAGAVECRLSYAPCGHSRQIKVTVIDDSGVLSLG